MLYSHDHDTYTYTCINITTHNKERVVRERELETEQNCNILTLTLLAIIAFLSCSPVLLNRGLVLSTASFLQLVWAPTDWTSCALRYIIVRRTPSCGRHKSHSFNPSTVKVIFWYSSTGCTCYLHRCISHFDSFAGVNMLHVCRDLLTNINRSDHSFAQEKLHPGTAGND